MTAGKNVYAEKPKESVFTISRTFDAPKELVWKVWTDTEHLKHWWGPQGAEVLDAKLDLHPGGIFHYRMRYAGQDMWGKFVFREIKPFEKMVWVNSFSDEKAGVTRHPFGPTWPLEMLTTLIFTEEKGKTTLTVHWTPLSPTEIERKTFEGGHGSMRQGWTGTFDQLTEYLFKAKGTKPAAADTSDREIVITRIINAPRERVWEAVTDPKQVVHWWGPNGFTTTIHEMDVRPGGVWRHTMRGPDGTEYPNKSTFIEIVKNERIVYAHVGSKKGDLGVSFEATWTFEAQGDKTKLTLRSVFPSAAARDRVVQRYNAIEGGKQNLGRLAEYLAGKSAVPALPFVIERTFNAPAARVWEAITDKDQMKQWYFDLAEFRPEEGFEFQFVAAKDEKKYLHLCKITEVIAGKKLAYSWRYDRYEGNSLVTFELFAEGNKTRLKLTHEGLETFPKSNPDLAKENFAEGWTSLIGTSLKQFVENTKA